jgi:predicted MPP superfamily phosphohydrolase
VHADLKTEAVQRRRPQPGFWRVIDRLQLLFYRGGWPARLSRFLGYHPPLRVAHHEVKLRRAWHAPRALTVAFASDFHAGPTTDPGLLAAACDALRTARPDVLLLGGDFVSLTHHGIDWLADLLATIPAPFGRFAVLGNHDYWNGADYVTGALEAVGIEVLTNRNRRLEPPFEEVWVCGLDDFVSGMPDATSALAGADGVRLVLMHSPSNLLSLDRARFDLALCGHTHGGQIALPGGRALLGAPGPLSKVYNRGRFEVGHGGTLLVSVGLGCSTLPIRWNATAEVLVCRIAADSV